MAFCKKASDWWITITFDGIHLKKTRLKTREKERKPVWKWDKKRENPFENERKREKTRLKMRQKERKPVWKREKKRENPFENERKTVWKREKISLKKREKQFEWEKISLKMNLYRTPLCGSFILTYFSSAFCSCRIDSSFAVVSTFGGVQCIESDVLGAVLPKV